MNPDRFKMVYEQLQPEEIKEITEIKLLASELSERFVKIPSREMSIALTNLEQGIMWAVKAICIQSEQIKNRGDQS